MDLIYKLDRFLDQKNNEMHVFLSASDNDLEVAKRIVESLSSKKIVVAYAGDLNPGEDISDYFTNKIIVSDIHLVLYTENSINSRGLRHEVIASEAIQRKDQQLSIIPIVAKGISLDNKRRKSIRFDLNNMEESLEELVRYVEGIRISKLQEEKKIQESKKAIINATSDYVKETTDDLEYRERYFSRVAAFCNIVGLVFLMLGVYIGWSIYDENLKVLEEAKDHIWEFIVSMTIKGAIIIVLLISASRYCFNLGKTFMNEALKNSDRRHALGFGKVYLERFRGEISREDFKEAFQDWNYNGKSSFLDLNSRDYDPELLENLTKIADSIRSINNEKKK